MSPSEGSTIPVRTIHDAMLAAAAGGRPLKPEYQGVETVPTSVRLPKPLRATAEEICANNGTNLGQYLRQCVVALVQDYVPNPEAVADLGAVAEENAEQPAPPPSEG